LHTQQILDLLEKRNCQHAAQAAAVQRENTFRRERRIKMLLQVAFLHVGLQCIKDAI